MDVALVTGAAGLLGRTVAHALTSSGHEVHAFAREQLDVADQASVAEVFHAVHPRLVVHCAAMTDVDDCETDSDRAWAVNADGAGFVAAAAVEMGAEIVAVSTDYVFDGEKGGYIETDQTNPIQEYGRTKLAGEDRVREANPSHYIVRSAWIYGPGGKNFLSRLPELARGHDPIKVIADQRSSPTFAEDLAEAIVGLCGSGRYGTYHVVNEGSCSYAEFVRAAFDVLGAEAAVEPVSHVDLPRLAPRPGDSSLVAHAWVGAGFERLRPWQDALKSFLGHGSNA